MKLIKKWHIHATIQNIINFFPKELSYKIYYWVQLRFGRLNKKEPLPYLNLSKSISNYSKKYIKDDKGFLELGTGRTITTLIGLWILGYNKIITIDLNPYLSEKLTKKHINYIVNNSEKVFDLFKQDINEKEFLNKMEKLSQLKDKNLNSILELLNIRYIPYLDAGNLDILKSSSINVYFSNQVLEHIPYDVLKKIFYAGKRVLTKNGLFIHFIGLHDHFATIDKSISKINFLKFNELTWSILSGNKFMYHNRLRISDYYKLFDENKYDIIEKEITIDKVSLNLLENGFKISNRFQKYKKEDLATVSCVIISKNIIL